MCFFIMMSLEKNLVTLFLLRPPSSVRLSKIGDATYPCINRGWQNVLNLKCFKVEVDSSNYFGSIPNSERMFWVEIAGTTYFKLEQFQNYCHTVLDYYLIAKSSHCMTYNCLKKHYQFWWRFGHFHVVFLVTIINMTCYCLLSGCFVFALIWLSHVY